MVNEIHAKDWKKDFFEFFDETGVFQKKIKDAEGRQRDYNSFFDDYFRKGNDDSLYYRLPYIDKVTIQEKILPEREKSIPDVKEATIEKRSFFYRLFYNPLDLLKRKKKKVESLDDIVKEVKPKPIFQEKTIFEERDYLEDYLGDEASIKEAIMILEKENSFVLKKSDGEVLTENYNGPQLVIYTDSNVEIDNNDHGYSGLVKRLCSSSDSIKCDVLGIIKEEAHGSGLKNRDLTYLPKSIFGKNPFMNRHPLNSNQVKSTDSLFKILNDFYKGEVASINSFVERNTLERSYHSIKGDSQKMFDSFLERAKDYCNEREIIQGNSNNLVSKDSLGSEEYLRWTAKTMINLCSGNGQNYRADKILASTTMALNLVDEKNKHLIFSADSDMDYYMNTFVNNILPRYVAKSVINVLEENERNPSDLYKRAVYDMANGALTLEQSDSTSEKISAGLYYNLTNKQFKEVQIPKNVRNLFNNIYSEKSKEIILDCFDNQKNGDLMSRLFCTDSSD